MIYNSNGNNTPYQTGGNAKVNKQLKALEEAIESVNDGFNDFLGKIDLYTGEDFIHGYSEQNRFTDNTGRVKALEATVNGTQETKSLDQKILDVDDRVTELGTEVNTVDLTATNGDFHKVVAGKYVFQNGYSITGTSICKINNGSVVYATDGTNSVLIDYTDKDAWVAKAKVEDGEHFSIYSNGVLTFTQSGGWSVYVIGNDFDTDTSIPEETPVNIETGVTIGGNLYAALGREYDFDSITSDEASIRIATITGNISAPNADIDEINSDEITVADLTATDADIESLNNSKRNFKDYKSISTHQTNLVQFIRIPRFTGTYNLRLVKNVNGADTDLFTATIIWNGHDPIVQYKEYSDNEALDYLYSIILTEHNLYFVTQGDGKLYYGWDAFDAQVPDNSLVFPFVASIPSEILAEGLRAEYITRFHNRTVFFGNHTNASGVDVLGQITADELSGPEKKDINYRGKKTVADLATLDAESGDIYTVTDNGYTTNKFVEGAGKPINAGDDVVAVEVETAGEVEITNTDIFFDTVYLRTENDGTFVFSLDVDRIRVGKFISEDNITPISEITISYKISSNDHFVLRKAFMFNGKIVLVTLHDIFVSEDKGLNWTSEPIIKEDSTPVWEYYLAYSVNNIVLIHADMRWYVSNDMNTWNALPWNDDSYEGGDDAGVILDDGTVLYEWSEYGYTRHWLTTRDGVTFNNLFTSDGGSYFMMYALNDKEALMLTEAPDEHLSVVNIETGIRELEALQSDITSSPGTSGWINNPIIKKDGKLISNTALYSEDNGETWLPLANREELLENIGLNYLAYVFDVKDDVMAFVPYLNFSLKPAYISFVQYYRTFSGNKTLKWDKFAAGVNYENFVAQNITASTALKSEGTLEVDGATTLNTLEVDGTSRFDDDVTVNAELNADKVITPDLEVTDVMTANSTGVDVIKNVTHTGNYTATGNQTITGNLTRTGNETISGLVIIGDLD